MTLRIMTSRITYRGTDRLDITRKSGGADGLPFAPSWAILRPALGARLQAETIRKAPQRAGAPSNEMRAAAIEQEAWAAYVPLYTQEMRASYRAQRPAWGALLARERVVLCCYCTDAEHCHRTLLAGFLVKLGAIYEGEHAHSLFPAREVRS